MIPLSLYIHIPWCEKKCPYCDFNSHQAREAVDETAYIKALLADLDADLHNYQSALSGRELGSIFIGGGTPSLFSADSIERLLNGVKERMDCVSSLETTLEANPGSAETAKFTGFRQAGVNRLSIGVQSFNNAHLRSLGRIHNAQNAQNAARFAIETGFSNFNLDLMFGLPKQTTGQAIEDVQQAIAQNPAHLSCYQLTIEPNTLFHHQPPPTPDDELLWEMQTEIQKQLAAANYQQYEVSAYSQAAQQCQHNLNYWQFGDYLGIGAGAHGKITSPKGVVNRYWKIKHPASYLTQESFVGGSSTIEKQDLPFEFMLNALRLTEGFDLNLFEQRTHLDRRFILPKIEQQQQQGLADLQNGRLHLTARGKSMLDTLLQDYLPATIK